jgi:hypothetical protein
VLLLSPSARTLSTPADRACSFLCSRTRSSRRILQLAGISTWQHKPAARRVVIDFDDDLAK